ncbi:hypothetical protein Ahy_B04g070722 isoform A [Arachis hypogaea]|uniref:At2g35280-like TPR domain-containing protein n=3 Tax=Arachis hypogaea TaxID=3818 RepID=A0A444ZIV8_ARAHY|nr:hypothetical protein Ahy_B04g070722 isoform A [Arachis hypogaea]
MSFIKIANNKNVFHVSHFPFPIFEHRGKLENKNETVHRHLAEPLQMVGSSKINRKEGNVPVEHECPLNLLPRNIWVRIATKVASNSIHDMFNMQASCKVFLDAASSETVYQHVTMRVIPLVSFLFYLDWPERRFIDRCIEAGNADAILRQGLTEYFWIGRRGIGMELLSRAWMEVSVEAGYLSAMLLLCDHENEEEM